MITFTLRLRKYSTQRQTCFVLCGDSDLCWDAKKGKRQFLCEFQLMFYVYRLKMTVFPARFRVCDIEKLRFFYEERQLNLCTLYLRKG